MVFCQGSSLFAALGGFFLFSEQGAFLWTRRFLFLQKTALKVRQLPAPSTAISSGHLAYRQVRSQNSMPQRSPLPFSFFVPFHQVVSADFQLSFRAL